MTKHVRIENADTSDFQVVVRVYEKGHPTGAPDELVHEVTLRNPCEITGQDVYLTGSRYIVITEAQAEH